MLIGNTKGIWPPFLRHLEIELDVRGDIAPHPLDRYVQATVTKAIEQLVATEGDLASPDKVYWVADTQPGKMILAQKMVLAAQQASHCKV